MKLELKNIGAIEDAEIDFNGITVVTGNNGTGKSTIAKSLYLMFEYLKDVDEDAYNKRISEIAYLVGRYLRIVFRERGEPYFFDIYNKIKQNETQIAHKIYESYLEQNPRDDSYLEKVISDEIYFIFQSLDSSGEVPLASTITQRINEKNSEMPHMQKEVFKVLEISNEEYKELIIEESISNIFEQDCIRKNANSGSIYLSLKDSKNSLELSENKVVFKKNIQIENSVLYIDNLNILDYVIENSQPFRTPTFLKLEKMKGYDEKLKEYLAKEMNENTSPEIIVNKKIIKLINSIVDNYLIYLDPNGKKQRLHIKNIATGVKIFEILKILLEKGNIQRRDVIILDEPEVHLHPDWQLLLAEVVVILQKELEITFLINTHSPYFVEAINVFSKKYEIDKNCTFYNVELVTNEMIKINNVSSNLSIIFEKMSKALSDLRDIAMESENE